MAGTDLATLEYPPEGAFRIHRAPTQLRPRDGIAGLDRFDDPRDGYQRGYRVRYLASTVRGSLLEILDHFRSHDGVETELAAVSGLQGVNVLEEEPAGLVPDAWLSRQRITVGRVEAGRSFIDVAAAETLAVLNESRFVQTVLRSGPVRQAFGQHVRLDLGTICAVGPIGRAITQAVSQAIFLLPARPSGISYVTRFDPSERCWAVFDERAEMSFTDPEPLEYFNPDIRKAMGEVADLYGLRLPAQWY
jgi:hypothetical protein